MHCSQAPLLEAAAEAAEQLQAGLQELVTAASGAASAIEQEHAVHDGHNITAVPPQALTSSSLSLSHTADGIDALAAAAAQQSTAGNADDPAQGDAEYGTGDHFAQGGRGPEISATTSRGADLGPALQALFPTSKGPDFGPALQALFPASSTAAQNGMALDEAAGAQLR